MASVQHLICDAELFPHHVLKQQKAFQGVEKERHFAAVTIQKSWRGYVVRKEIARWHRAATVLQSYVRRWLVKWHMCETYRAYMDRYRLRYYNKMATRIQALWRGYWIRKTTAKDIFGKRAAEEAATRMQQLFGAAFSNMDNFKKEMLNDEAHKWVIYIIFKLHHLLRTYPTEGIYSSHNKKTLSSIEKLLKALPLKNYAKAVKKKYNEEIKKPQQPFPYLFKNKKLQTTEYHYRKFIKEHKPRDVNETDKNIHDKQFHLTKKLDKPKYERQMLLSTEKYPGTKYDLTREKIVEKQVTPRDFDLNILKNFIGEINPPNYYIDFWSKICNIHNIPETVDDVNIRPSLVLFTNMEHEDVVPDVIDAAPKRVATITYPSGVSVNLGNILTPTQVKDIPSVKWIADKSTFYTLCMTDPDAPSRKDPKFREWHHWLVGNIPGDNISEGETLSEYVGSGPPPSTGLHRYVFLIYKQHEKIIFKGVPRLTNRSADNRGGFSIKNFAAKFNLGNPIAGNFYKAEYDDYVPLLYKQLGAA